MLIYTNVQTRAFLNEQFTRQNEKSCCDGEKKKKMKKKRLYEITLSKIITAFKEKRKT